MIEALSGMSAFMNSKGQDKQNLDLEPSEDFDPFEPLSKPDPPS